MLTCVVHCTIASYIFFQDITKRKKVTEEIEKESRHKTKRQRKSPPVTPQIPLKRLSLETYHHESKTSPKVEKLLHNELPFLKAVPNHK